MAGRRVEIHPFGGEKGVDGQVGLQGCDEIVIEPLDQAQFSYAQHWLVGWEVGWILLLVVDVLVTTVDFRIVEVQIVEQVLREVGNDVFLLGRGAVHMLDHAGEEVDQELLGVGDREALVLFVQFPLCLLREALAAFAQGLGHLFELFFGDAIEHLACDVGPEVVEHVGGCEALDAVGLFGRRIAYE